MPVKWKITLGIIGSVLVVTPTAVALAQPQAAACALINYRGLDEVATGILASSDVPIGQRLDFVRLHTAGETPNREHVWRDTCLACDRHRQY